MIILDTNVISEATKLRPNANVQRWLKAQLGSSLFTTSITLAEMLFGVVRMPEGHRKRTLAGIVQRLFEHGYYEQMLNFDRSAAEAYAQLVANKRQAGQIMSVLDAQIAAIAKSRGAKLATRNTKDFENCEIEIINPWHCD